jgi:thiazole synthase
MTDVDRPAPDRPLQVGSLSLASRLIVGTGKYPSLELMRACHAASGADLVTVAVRRIDLGGGQGPPVLDYVDRARIRLLPNTAGCFDVASAVRTAELARELLGVAQVKLEVLGDERTLLPDPVGTLEATRELARGGFEVWVYCSDDPRLGARLAEAGATAIMPAGSPIGSGQGVLNPANVLILRELVRLPIIVDAGVGTASDVALAMELGVDGVLLNSAIALARDPLRMAGAMRDACRAGRSAFLAGRIPRKLYGSASSPIEGSIGGGSPHA